MVKIFAQLQNISFVNLRISLLISELDSCNSDWYAIFSCSLVQYFPLNFQSSKFDFKLMHKHITLSCILYKILREN